MNWSDTDVLLTFFVILNPKSSMAVADCSNAEAEGGEVRMLTNGEKAIISLGKWNG